jgi:hypothetical protein
MRALVCGSDFRTLIALLLQQGYRFDSNCSTDEAPVFVDVSQQAGIVTNNRAIWHRNDRRASPGATTTATAGLTCT